MSLEPRARLADHVHVSMAPVAATSPEILNDARRAPRAGEPSGHVAALTGLRGFAALMVLLVHGSGLTEYSWMGLHGYGPIALFTLSGYLLFQPWSKWILGVGKRPSVVTFAWRRFWRIFPAFVTVVLFICLIHPLARPEGINGWLRLLTLTSIYNPNWRLSGLDHTWSLGTELSWYAALPLIGFAVAALAFRTRLGRIRAVVVAAACALGVTAVWRWTVAFQLEDLAHKIMFPVWLPQYLVCFLGGALIAHLLLARRYGKSQAAMVHWLGQRPYFVLLVAGVSALIANSKLGGPWTFADTSFAEMSTRAGLCTVTALLLLLGIAADDPHSVLVRMFSVPWLVAVGRWSYGVFLWHLPIVAMAWEMRIIPRGGTGYLVWITSLALISSGLGAATFAFIERPVSEWARRKR